MEDTTHSPSLPPITCSDLRGTDGRIGPAPEDFQVDEVPLYAPSGEGEHLYVRLRKRGMTTRDATRIVADAAGVPPSEIGTAGMKDKHALTTQWISLPARRAKPVEAWVLPGELGVVESARHKNKLRTGHLLGNHFKIRLVETSADALTLAERIVEALTERGLPNYFGAQRFGRDGDNVAAALAWLGGVDERARKRLAPFERKLFASVVQSEIFNRYVTARIAEGLVRPLEGEVVRLDGSGAQFVVEDPERELSRWTSRDIHPTGPMIGPKMRPALGRALELEEAAILSLGLDDVARAALARFADGTRRDLLLWPARATGDGGGLRAFRDGTTEDALVLEFFLPSGSYATELVREFTREPFFRYSA